ncbi:MAG: hypothetical protein IKX30_09440 [Victivallales bacterium]|nr:hypothetical protein [Victivallales bacterium]
MPHFARNSCIAYTWNDDGDCRAVMVTRSGDKCKIAKLVNAKANQDTSVAEVLANTAKSLNAKDAAFTVATGVGYGWDMADVTMPNLPPEELRNAIAFELRKHTPLSLDKIRWGYRSTIAKQDKKQGNRTRIIYVKSEIFDKWTANVSALGQLDMAIPPAAALDPLFEDATVTIPNGDGTATAYAPSPEGRVASAVSIDDLTLDKALPGDFIKWNELESLPKEEQMAYIPAVVLAAYGLTSAAGHDTASMLPLPPALKPRRNVFMTLCASILLAISLLALIIYAVIGLQGRSAQIRALEKELKKVNTELDTIQKQIKPEKKKAIVELRKEMTDVTPNIPPLPFVLLDLSKSIPSPAWLSGNFTWDEGLVKFTLEEPVTDPTLTATIDTQELLDIIEDSPYIGDVRGLKSNYDARNNKRTRDFDMNARYDTAAEAERAKQRNQERAEAARRKAAEERKAKEEQMKEDAKQDTDEQSQDGDGETNSPRSGMRPSSGMRSGFSPRGSDRRGGFSRSQNGGDFNRPQNDGDDFGPGQPPPGNDGFQPPQQPPEGMNFPPAPGGGDGGQNGNGFNPQNFPGGMPPTPPMDNTRNVRTR